MRSHATPQEPTESVEAATAETGAPDLAARLATLDTLYTLVSRAGIPHAAPVPFATVESLTAENLAAINAAWFRDAMAAIGTATTGEGFAANYSDSDKQAVGVAMLNGGGIVAGKQVDPFKWEPDGALSLLEESIDRVRFDYGLWAGFFNGEYDEHKTAADLKSRAPAREAIRKILDQVPGDFKGLKDTKRNLELPPKSGFGDGKTYGELVEDKSKAVLAARHKVRTRTTKAKTEDIPV